jgi:hypothetical protein
MGGCMIIANRASIKTSRLVMLALKLLLKENTQRFLDEVLLDFNEVLKKKSLNGRKTDKHYRSFSKSYSIPNCPSAPSNIKLKLVGNVRFAEWTSNGFKDTDPTLVGINASLTPYTGSEFEFVSSKIDEAISKAIEREIFA